MQNPISEQARAAALAQLDAAETAREDILDGELLIFWLGQLLRGHCLQIRRSA